MRGAAGWVGECVGWHAWQGRAPCPALPRAAKKQCPSAHTQVPCHRSHSLRRCIFTPARPAPVPQILDKVATESAAHKADVQRRIELRGFAACACGPCQLEAAPDQPLQSHQQALEAYVHHWGYLWALGCAVARERAGERGQGRRGRGVQAGSAAAAAERGRRRRRSISVGGGAGAAQRSFPATPSRRSCRILLPSAPPRSQDGARLQAALGDAPVPQARRHRLERYLLLLPPTNTPV